MLSRLYSILYSIIRAFKAFLEGLGGFVSVASDLFNSASAIAWMLFFSIAVTLLDIYLFRKWIHKEGRSRGLYFFILFGTLQSIVIWIWNFFVFLYQYGWISSPVIVVYFRWLLVFGLGGVGIYLYTRKLSGSRGLFTYLGHTGLFLLGWLVGHWTGILFISIPLLAAYYYTMYLLALAIVPAADPDAPLIHSEAVKELADTIYASLNKFFHTKFKQLLPTAILGLKHLAKIYQKAGGEKWQRFMVLLWYMWGVQYPAMVVTNRIGREINTRIPGNQFKRSGAPGLIWSHSNQAVGLTTGPKFSRVGGPGMIFTHHFERPIQIEGASAPRTTPGTEAIGCVDLRTQLRGVPIEAVSKDGHPFQAILLASFAIDRDEWTLAEYHRLQKANPILVDGRNLDQPDGSYPYNRARVQAALTTTALSASTATTETKAIHWDEWVLNRIVETARQTLSQRNLDELWHPRSDGPGKNALDEIGGEIKAIMEPRLREHGIKLFASRVVNYNIDKNHPIVKQQIATWSSTWEKRASETLADGQAEADRLKLEAKAYARSMFLTLVAEGLQQARLVNKKLPNYVIAMRVIDAMEEILKQQPQPISDESRERLDAVKQKKIISHS